MDIKHFLCWLLVARNPWKGLEMLGQLEIYKADYLHRLAAAAVKLEQEDTAGKIRKMLAAWNASIYERSLLDYARNFVAQNVRRAENQDKSFKKWIYFRTTWAAMRVITDQMSDLALLDFVAAFATTKYVEEYMGDKERGFYSTWDRTRWSRRGKLENGFVDGFVYGWRTSFPTFVRRHDVFTKTEARDFTAVLSGQYGPFGTTEP